MSKHADPARSAPQPSWAQERRSAPARPRFESNLPEETFAPRPRRVIVAFVLVLVAVAGIWALTALAALQYGDLRDGLMDALPDDVVEDYDEEDLRLAADVMLGAAGAVVVVTGTIQALALRALLARRSAGARILFVVFAVLGIPLVLAAFVVREAPDPDFAAGAALTLVIVIAASIVCGPAVTRWVRQPEPRRTIPVGRAAAALSPDR